jgi:hypothetical protein
MGQPSSYSMSWNTSLLLKAAGAAAAMKKISTAGPACNGLQAAAVAYRRLTSFIRKRGNAPERVELIEVIWIL